MNDPGPDRLYSWKEIASYLEVSVRTAQLWERDRGLPVYRLPGPRGRAYAIVPELEAWVKGDLPGSGDPGGADDGAAAATDAPHPAGTIRPAHGPSAGHRWTAGAVIVGGLGVIAALGLGLPYLLAPPPSPGEPAASEILERELVVRDADGHELWRADQSRPLRAGRYDGTQRELQPDFADIDGDGLAEVLFVAHYADLTRTDELVAYDDDGTELWRHRMGQPVSTETESFDAVFRTGPRLLVPQPDGTMDVILAAHHQIFYPSVTTRLASSGRVKGRYWYAGHVGNEPQRLALLDPGDGRPARLALTGVSNARSAGVLVVVELDRMDGAAPESDPRYRFLGIPPAREVMRVFFPRSFLTPDSSRYAVGNAIRRGSDGLYVSVEQIPGAEPAHHVIYSFDHDLNLVGVSPGDDFIAAFRRLTAEGRITWSLEEETRRLAAIERVHPAGSSPAGK